MSNPFINQLPRRDGFTWLHNSETGGTWECPDPAVEAWVARGWEPCDPPVEVNPATAHWITPEAEPEKPAKKAAKAAPKSDQKPEES